MELNSKYIYNGKYLRLTTSELEKIRLVLLNNINKNMECIDELGETNSNNVKEKGNVLQKVNKQLVVYDTLKALSGNMSLEEFFNKIGVDENF